MGFIGIQRPQDPDRRDVSSEPLQPDLTEKPYPDGKEYKVRVPVYGRPWFGYAMGAIVTAAGVLTVVPATKYIGLGLCLLCGPYLTWAGLDAKRKSGENTWIDALLQAIRAALEALEKYLKKRGK